MSDTYKCPWKEVYEMGVLEFLNVVSYRKEKDRRQEEALENWRRQNLKK